MATVLAVAGLVTSIVGIAGQATAGVQAAESQAEIAEAEGVAEREKAAFAERQFRKRAKVVQAEAVAKGAAAGLDITGGSSLLLLLENAREAEIEALGIRSGGEISEASKRFEAKVSRQAKTGIILGGVARGGTVLSQFIARPGATKKKEKKG